MKLPNGERAIVEIAKLHPRGRHKARVFASRLGISTQHAAMLRDALLRAARKQPASLGFIDDYGQRYVIDCEVNGPGGKAIVRSSWIILSGENAPRLTTCFVL